MEVYRALENNAIYLSAPAGGGGDVSGYPNGIPNSTSTWYTKYQGDTAAYAAARTTTTRRRAELAALGDARDDRRRVRADPGLVVDVPPGGLSPDPTKAVQMVVGPDGQSYPVFTYIIMVNRTARAAT